ncbi:MAG: pilus assembly protein TadG-related protein [Solirubrobacteraceae bacterium]
MRRAQPAVRGLKRRSGQESGVVLVLVAGMLLAFLGMAALAIDIGSFYKAQRQAQTAADAGALAASQDLPTGTAAASQDGTTYALKNYPGATVNVTTNYNNTPTKVQVKVTASTPSFFGQIFGITHANVSASAVAGGNGSAAPAAIFGYDDKCSDPGVALNGNALTVNGAVVSNGSLSMNDNPSSTVTTGTYGGPNNCTFNNLGKGSFTYGPTFTPNLTAFPTDFRNNPPACTATPTPPATTFSWSSNNQTIPAGVYCANEIDLTGNHLSNDPAGVTFIANTFVISGNNPTFTAPSSTGLLFWDTGTTVFDVTSNHIGYSGTIFAPTATVQIDGNAAGTGFIEANNVIINGNAFDITGTGPVMGGNGNSLVQ